MLIEILALMLTGFTNIPVGLVFAETQTYLCYVPDSKDHSPIRFQISKEDSESSDQDIIESFKLINTELLPEDEDNLDSEMIGRCRNCKSNKTCGKCKKGQKWGRGKGESTYGGGKNRQNKQRKKLGWGELAVGWGKK